MWPSGCWPQRTTSAHARCRTFEQLHLQELTALFVQVVHLACECGLVKLGTVAVDGTKLKANANRLYVPPSLRSAAQIPCLRNVCLALRLN